MMVKVTTVLVILFALSLVLAAYQAAEGNVAVAVYWFLVAMVHAMNAKLRSADNGKS